MNMNFVKEFNQCLKETEKKQKEIAKDLNIKPSSITEYKKGRSYPSLEIFWKICQYFEISPNEILGWKN